METLISILILLVFLSFLFGLVSWTTHLNMTKGARKAWGWGNYKTFKREFYKYTYTDKGWRSSLFSNEKKSKFGWLHEEMAYLHASIIVFENKGMLMRTPIDYILAQCLIRKTARQLNKKNKVVW